MKADKSAWDCADGSATPTCLLFFRKRVNACKLRPPTSPLTSHRTGVPPASRGLPRTGEYAWTVGSGAAAPKGSLRDGFEPGPPRQAGCTSRHQRTGSPGCASTTCESAIGSAGPSMGGWPCRVSFGSSTRRTAAAVSATASRIRALTNRASLGNWPGSVTLNHPKPGTGAGAVGGRTRSAGAAVRSASLTFRAGGLLATFRNVRSWCAKPAESISTFASTLRAVAGKPSAAALSANQAGIENLPGKPNPDRLLTSLTSAKMGR
jgi:hypothetical protein